MQIKSVEIQRRKDFQVECKVQGTTSMEQIHLIYISIILMKTQNKQAIMDMS